MINIMMGHACSSLAVAAGSWPSDFKSQSHSLIVTVSVTVSVSVSTQRLRFWYIGY